MTRGVQPRPPRSPTTPRTRRRRRGRRRKEGLEATQADADAAAKRFWQRSSWYRRANIHNESPRRPAASSTTSRPRAPSSRPSCTDAADAGDADGHAAGSRTSGSRRSPRSRSSGWTSRTPSSAATRATTSCSASPAPDDEPPVDLLRREIARLEPQRVYLPLGGRRPRRPPAGPRRRPRAPPRRPPLGDARTRLRRPGRPVRGLPVRVVGGLQPARGPARRARSTALPDGVSLTAEFADISDQLERKIRGDRDLREPDRAAVRQPARRWPRPSAATRPAPARPRPGAGRRSPSATGSRRRPDRPASAA